MSLSFDNTKVAFSSKTNRDLLRSYLLFKLISDQRLVKLGKFLMNYSIKLHLPIKGIIKSTIFKQFCGGETIEECNRVIEDLGRYGIGTILDYSVEGKTSEADFDNTTEETLRTIRRASGDSRIPFSVFKVTGIARFGLLEKINSKISLSAEEEKEFQRVRSRVNKICKLGHETGTPVFIDAEESWIQDAIDQIADDMMALYNKERPIVFNTFQLYRHDRLEFLKSTHIKGREAGFFVGAKLVRGAYMEKERERAKKKGYRSPIQENKESTDRDYDLALHYSLENIKEIAICAGTHNENSSLLLAGLLVKKGIEKNHPHIYFSQLLGMSDHISYNLADSGYNVAKYVPYGPIREVLPYLIRRAQENTSVKGQTGRELGLIIRERNRRRKLA